MEVFLNGYWKKNLGDDLFVKTICERYPDSNFYLEADPKDGSVFNGIKNLTVLYKNNDLLYKLIRRLKFPFKSFSNYYSMSNNIPIYIEIGGSIFIIDNIRQAKKAYKKRLRIRRIASKYFIIGSNFGPYIDDRQITEYNNFFSSTDGVVFRDIHSSSLFNSKNIKTAPDAVLSLNTICESSNQNYIIISFVNLKSRNGFSKEMIDNYEQNIIDICNYYLLKNKTIVLFGFCEYENDNDFIERVSIQLSPKYKKNIIKYVHNDINKSLHYIYNSEMIIATRFHAMILGWLYGKPTIVFSYSDKIVNTIKYCYPNQKYYSIKECDSFDTQLLDEYNNQIMPDYIKSNLISSSNEQFYYFDQLIGETDSNF